MTCRFTGAESSMISDDDLDTILHQINTNKLKDLSEKA